MASEFVQSIGVRFPHRDGRSVVFWRLQRKRENVCKLIITTEIEGQEAAVTSYDWCGGLICGEIVRSDHTLSLQEYQVSEAVLLNPGDEVRANIKHASSRPLEQRGRV